MLKDVMKHLLSFINSLFIRQNLTCLSFKLQDSEGIKEAGKEMNLKQWTVEVRLQSILIDNYI